MPISRAWEFFGQGNGCVDETEMRRRIAAYRRRCDDGREDPEIGCIMLRDVRFLASENALEAPSGWKGNIGLEGQHRAGP